MVKKVLLGLVALIAVFVIIVATRPAEFRIERSAQINAPAEVVFAQVNDFKNWDAWSPWAKLDPASKTTFAGPPAGTGAVFAWSGNDKIGEGRMTVTESRANELIRIRLDFVRPFEATNTAEFTFTPEGNHTVVTWSNYGNNTFLAKAFCLFVDMDKMLGGEFEKGLAQMKSVAEATAKK